MSENQTTPPANVPVLPKEPPLGSTPFPKTGTPAQPGISNPSVQNTKLAETQAKAPVAVKMMKVANCTIRLSQGHTVPGLNVTPAEALLLSSIHRVNSGGEVIEDIRDVHEVPRSVQQELARLRSKYHPDKIRHAFPGNIPTFPESYDEASVAGLSTNSPDVNLGEVKIDV